MINSPCRSRHLSANPWVHRYFDRRHGSSISTATRTYRPYSATAFCGASNLPQQIDLLDSYRGLVALGRIRYDEQQIRIVMQTDGYAPPAFATALLAHQPHLPGTDVDSATPWWSHPHEELDSADTLSLVRLRNLSEELASLNSPKGLLITGPPGSGKSFLVDLWYAALPTPYKARKHYNQLVLELYRAVWEETQRRMIRVQATKDPPESEPRPTWNSALREQWRHLAKLDLLPPRWRRNSRDRFKTSMFSDGQPTIAFVIAQRLVLRHWLLVFDEIQLLDVSSAGLLSDVLSWYWRMGGIVVGTSNKVPDDLYKNGVQRERLEPFVEALKMRCPVVSISASKDWRRLRGAESQGRTWFTLGQETSFEEALRSSARHSVPESESKCTASTGPDAMELPTNETFDVYGRSLRVPWSLNGVCKFTFAGLCDQSLGPADYLTLASGYHTLVITDIPVLRLSAKNQARRFISLIDALYEARCRLICHAETDPENLFFPDATQESSQPSSLGHDVMHVETVAEMQDMYRPNVSMYDAPSMSSPPVQSTVLRLDRLDIFSGQEEQFAFQRALSRLIEMTSLKYRLEERWNPLPLSERKWEGKADLGLTGSRDEVESNIDSLRVEERRVSDDAVDDSVGLMTRPDAPRLSPDHVWAARDDWGKKAKQWGKGAKVFDESRPR